MQSVVDWIINKDKEIPDNTTIVQVIKNGDIIQSPHTTTIKFNPRWETSWLRLNTGAHLYTNVEPLVL